MNKIEPIPWRGIRVVEKLIALAILLAAAAVLILPFLDAVIVRRLARLTGAANVISWLINERGTWIVGAALLAVFVLFMFLVRRRLINNRGLWFGTGCPNCMERELVRVSRKGGDRLYGLLALPAYRYACRNCTWRGLRIARREQSREREAELEAALLRFDPDSPLPSPPADEEDAGHLALPAAGPTTGYSSLFRDPGDVTFLDEARGRARFETVGDEAAPATEEPGERDDQPDDESPEGLEWLWRSSEL